MSKRGQAILFSAIVAVAIAIRFWGLVWGLPERADLHPDEHDFVMYNALGVLGHLGVLAQHARPLDITTLDPVFLNYPGFLMYLIAFGSLFLHAMGVVTEPWQCYMVGRVIVTLYGVATVPVVYALAKEMRAPPIGALLAALGVAIMPLHVWEGHTATTDVPMTFWIMVTLLMCLRILRMGRWRDYIYAGIALGLAVGSKYTAAFAAVPVVVAAALAGRPFWRPICGLILAAVVSQIACFLVTPYSYIRLHDMELAMVYEHHHTLSSHYGFSVYAMGWWYHRWIYQVLAAWPFSLGIALYLCCLAGTCWALFRMDRQRFVLLSFAAVFFAITGSWHFTPLRYYLPILVVAVVFAGAWLGEWMCSERRVLRAAALIAACITLVYTCIFTFQTSDRYKHETRIAAGQWLESESQGGRIFICGWSRYHGLPRDTSPIRMAFISDVFARRTPGHRPTGVAARVVPVEEEFLRMKVSLPSEDLVSISSLDYQRHYRHGNIEMINAYNKLRDPAGPYELVRRFESHFINKDLYMKLDPMFEGYFVSPTIEIYRRKPHAPPALTASSAS